MEIPTYILFVLGCLGAADIALFHSVAHGIRSHADSVGELVTHSLRGPTYATLFLFIPNFELHGLFAWGLMALFVFDVGISVWDFWLEQGSRRFLGGLPSGEYVLHMLMAIVFGALVTSFLCFGHDWFTAPTRLVYAPAAAPIFLRVTLAIMAIAVLVSGMQDAAAAFRLSNRANAKEIFLRTRNVAHDVCRNPGFDRVERRQSSACSQVHERKARSWMRIVLCAAGVYNLVWGTWVVLCPEALFRLSGATVPQYPQIWECVGMIVGVYGIGYLIAAGDPFRHWPIIFMGLMGQVLGPLGMAWSITQNDPLASLAWMCLPNDLIWWAPFAFILLRKAQQVPTIRRPFGVWD